MADFLGLCPEQGQHEREGPSSRKRRDGSRISNGTCREPLRLAGAGLLALPPNPDTGTGGLQRVLQPQEVWGGLRDCESLPAAGANPGTVGWSARARFVSDCAPLWS